ncbi:hypothetical protein GQX73_g1708 [Xylaria multiplex]|uniref:Uncharacterized protein n=1 Tax=Xylaria multiplex TaxID=323545 RepID=A0A7C8IXX7_9PEZI|nr:hypothetical protein GQX73_g1708 [Xylaria multiplex]
MDTHPPNPSTPSKSRVIDYDGFTISRSPKDPQSSPSRREKPGPHAEANKKASSWTEDAKGVEGPDNETAVSNEPPSSETQSPYKKPMATPSSDISRGLTISDDDSKSRQNRLSVGDSSSIHTADSNDDRRMSDKVKKAWKEVRGQNNLDPLEQWMVKHSGGTFVEKPRVPPITSFRDDSDEQ